MRKSLLAAASCIAVLGAAPAALAAPTAAPVQAASADAATDAELRSFAAAMTTIQPIAEAAGGAPDADQQAQMAAAISDSGLTLERFNAISAAVSSDPVMQGRVAVAAAPPSPAGSVAAGVTDAEVDQFARAMNDLRPIAESLNGAAPNAEQQGQMASVISGSGLDLERFNAISTAVSQDERLRARMALSDARRGS